MTPSNPDVSYGDQTVIQSLTSSGGLDGYEDSDTTRDVNADIGVRNVAAKFSGLADQSDKSVVDSAAGLALKMHDGFTQGVENAGKVADAAKDSVMGAFDSHQQQVDDLTQQHAAAMQDAHASMQPTSTPVPSASSLGGIPDQTPAPAPPDQTPSDQPPPLIDNTQAVSTSTPDNTQVDNQLQPSQPAAPGANDTATNGAPPDAVSTPAPVPPASSLGGLPEQVPQPPVASPQSGAVSQTVPAPASASVLQPADERGALQKNGKYYEDPNFTSNMQRYESAVTKTLGPFAGKLAVAQARLETGNGQFLSTPFNYGNVGNTDTSPQGGGNYRNPEDAAAAWTNLMQTSPRYVDFINKSRAGADIPELAQSLKNSGYASDPDYVSKITSVAGHPLGPMPKDSTATTAALSAGASASALDWARSQLGKQGYIDFCEKFVENAQGQDKVYPSAIAAFNDKSRTGQITTDISKVQPNSIVYFSANNSNGGYGHTGLVSGFAKDGQPLFISATDNGIKEYRLDDWQKMTGQHVLGFAAANGAAPIGDGGGSMPQHAQQAFGNAWQAVTKAAGAAADAAGTAAQDVVQGAEQKAQAVPAAAAGAYQGFQQAAGTAASDIYQGFQAGATGAAGAVQQAATGIAGTAPASAVENKIGTAASALGTQVASLHDPVVNALHNSFSPDGGPLDQATLDKAKQDAANAPTADKIDPNANTGTFKGYTNDAVADIVNQGGNAANPLDWGSYFARRILDGTTQQATGGQQTEYTQTGLSKVPVVGGALNMAFDPTQVAMLLVGGGEAGAAKTAAMAGGFGTLGAVQAAEQPGATPESAAAAGAIGAGTVVGIGGVIALIGRAAKPFIRPLAQATGESEQEVADKIGQSAVDTLRSHEAGEQQPAGAVARPGPGTPSIQQAGAADAADAELNSRAYNMTGSEKNLLGYDPVAANQAFEDARAKAEAAGASDEQQAAAGRQARLAFVSDAKASPAPEAADTQQQLLDSWRASATDKAIDTFDSSINYINYKKGVVPLTLAEQLDMANQLDPLAFDQAKEVVTAPKAAPVEAPPEAAQPAAPPAAPETTPAPEAPTTPTEAPPARNITPPKVTWNNYGDLASRQGLTDLYHETSPDRAVSISTSAIDKGGLNVSPNPDLALGQGGKGAVIHFNNPDAMNVTPLRTKPGADMVASETGVQPEWRLSMSPSDSTQIVQDITFDGKLKASSIQARRLKALKWEQETLSNGKVRYTNPEFISNETAAAGTELPSVNITNPEPGTYTGTHEGGGSWLTAAVQRDENGFPNGKLEIKGAATQPELQRQGRFGDLQQQVAAKAQQDYPELHTITGKLIEGPEGAAAGFRNKFDSTRPSDTQEGFTDTDINDIVKGPTGAAPVEVDSAAPAPALPPELETTAERLKRQLDEQQQNPLKPSDVQPNTAYYVRPDGGLVGNLGTGAMHEDIAATHLGKPLDGDDFMDNMNEMLNQGYVRLSPAGSKLYVESAESMTPAQRRTIASSARQLGLNPTMDIKTELGPVGDANNRQVMDWGDAQRATDSQFKNDMNAFHASVVEDTNAPITTAMDVTGNSMSDLVQAFGGKPEDIVEGDFRELPSDQSVVSAATGDGAGVPPEQPPTGGPPPEPGEPNPQQPVPTEGALGGGAVGPTGANIIPAPLGGEGTPVRGALAELNASTQRPLEPKQRPALLKRLAGNIQHWFADDAYEVNLAGTHAREQIDAAGGTAVDKARAFYAMNAEAALADFNGARRGAVTEQTIQMTPLRQALGGNMDRVFGYDDTGRVIRAKDAFNNYTVAQRYLEVAKDRGHFDEDTGSWITEAASEGALEARPALERQGPGGLTDEMRANVALSELRDAIGNDNFAKVEAADKVRGNIAKWLLQTRVDSHMMAQEDMDNLLAKYPHYAPMSINDSLDNISADYGTRGLDQRSNLIKTIREYGSAEDVQPTHIALASAVGQTYMAAARAKATSTVANALLRDPEVNAAVVRTNASVVDPARRLAAPSDVTAPKLDPDSGTIARWSDGGQLDLIAVPKVYADRIHNALSGADLGFWDKVFNLTTAPMKYGSTALSPTFLAWKVVNGVMLPWMKNGGNPFTYTPEMARAFGAALQREKSPLYTEVARSGAFMGRESGWGSTGNTITNWLRQTDTLQNNQKELERMVAGSGGFNFKNAGDIPRFMGNIVKLDWVNRMNQAIDDTIRIQAYSKAIDPMISTLMKSDASLTEDEAKALSTDEAALAARRAYHDFSRGGSITKAMNPYMPFFNDVVRASLDVGRAIRDDPAGATIRLAALTGAMTGLNALNRSDPNNGYDDIPFLIRNSGMVAMLPGSKKGDPHFLYIPMKNLAIPAAAINTIMDHQYHTDNRAWQDSVKAILGDASPIREGVGPSGLIGGAVQLMFNTNWLTGGNIIPGSQVNAQYNPSEEFGPGTSNFARTLGAKLGIAPYQIDFALSSIGGSAATQTARATNLADSPLGKRNVPQLSPAGAFGIERSQTGQRLNDLYTAEAKAKSDGQSFAQEELQRDPRWNQLSDEQKQIVTAKYGNSLSARLMEGRFGRNNPSAEIAKAVQQMRIQGASDQYQRTMTEQIADLMLKSGPQAYDAVAKNTTDPKQLELARKVLGV